MRMHRFKGTAADIIKAGNDKMYMMRLKGGVISGQELLLQVHDELLVETAAG